ncbi:MAG: glycosyltransferase family 2 protein [Burkholderiaceae bacterium]|nr:glycosyltransferase family 2 protein [Burkholderiaceae bacterium]
MREMSLILATVGRSAELNRLFDTLVAQHWHDFEVVVVDQNPDERLLPILERARSLGLPVRHLRHSPPNLALARNAGIAASNARWLGFPDDDCWYEPHTLERVMLRSARRDQPHGVITRWVEQDPALPPGTLSWHRSSRFRDLPVSSITLFFRRELFERVGGFDGRLGVGQWFGAAEETDIVLRALRAGALLAYEPTALVHHRVDPPAPPVSAIARLAARRRARGTGAMYAKHRLPPWVIARGLLSPIIKPLARGALGADLAHGLAVAHGRLDGWLRWSREHPAADPFTDDSQPDTALK